MSKGGHITNLHPERAFPSALSAAKDPAARDKARTAYQNFLTLWKDADPDIPIYQQAKTEFKEPSAAFVADREDTHAA